MLGHLFDFTIESYCAYLAGVVFFTNYKHVTMENIILKTTLATLKQVQVTLVAATVLGMMVKIERGYDRSILKNNIIEMNMTQGPYWFNMRHLKGWQDVIWGIGMKTTFSKKHQFLKQLEIIFVFLKNVIENKDQCYFFLFSLQEVAFHVWREITHWTINDKLIFSHFLHYTNHIHLCFLGWIDPLLNMLMVFNGHKEGHKIDVDL
ncbi:hypothetical protein ACJX0J_027004 [Zea mays]